MITNNPYNLPQQIMKPNPQIKPIPLQNKKSRDRNLDFSKQISSKGIKIQSKMKKSLNLHHATSSPNLHTPSTSSSNNRPLEPPTLSRHVEYLQTPIQPLPQTQNDRKIKFLFEKFHQIHDQLANHDSLLNKLTNQKDKLRNSWDSPFQLNNPSYKQSRERDTANIQRNINSVGHLNLNISTNQQTIALRQVEQIKKQISNIKQQIANFKITFAREKDQEINPINTSRSIKFSSNHENENHSIERKFTEEFSKVCQVLEQMRSTNNERFIKIQSLLNKVDGNGQIIHHKANKAQQKIDNMESSIQSHMKIVNHQINSSLTKIVASINQKIAKALQNNIVLVNQKLRKCIQTCKSFKTQDKMNVPSLKPSNIEGKLILNKECFLKLSGYKAEDNVLKIKMKTSLVANYEMNSQKSGQFNQSSSKKSEYSPSRSSTQADEIILGETVYHIDADGYLMDENKIYLMDQSNNLLQLEAEKLIKIQKMGLLC